MMLFPCRLSIQSQAHINLPTIYHAMLFSITNSTFELSSKLTLLGECNEINVIGESINAVMNCLPL